MRLVKARHVFVPPKPKEFESTARIGFFNVQANGMKCPSNTGSGISRFIVGGATPCQISKTHALNLLPKATGKIGQKTKIT